MTTLHLYFVRHGETEWNLVQKMQGHKNSPLTALGREQAQKLGEKLASLTFDACFCSDSLRAQETLALIQPQVKHAPQVTPAIAEIRMGSWEGRLRKEIAQEDPAEWDAFWHDPQNFQGLNGGETFASLAARAQQFLADLKQSGLSGDILIVSHRITIKVLLNLLSGEPLAHLGEMPDILPNSLSQVRLASAGTDILQYSDISHYAVTVK